jgi:hypothetical protein
MIGAPLGLRDIERATRRFDTGHRRAAASEKQREGPCPAAHIQHAAGTQLLSEADIHIKVTAVGVERVIDATSAGARRSRQPCSRPKPVKIRHSIPGYRSANGTVRTSSDSV